MEISQVEKIAKFPPGSSEINRESSGVLKMFKRVRNVLDIPSTFTYHTQAFATGLTVAEEMFLGERSK